MAKDVITRFRLETTQYDSALRSSAEGLKEVVNMARLAGKDFDGFSQKAIDAAKALGDLDTGATNNRDKLKELVAAYNKMASTYNAMSDSMKQDEGGKALASSLDRLKERIGETKKEMYGLDSQGKQTGGMMEALGKKFMVTIDATKLLDLGLKAVKGALGVVGDAFKSSESDVDAWGRTMEIAGSLYDSFCIALNNSDLGSFFANIDRVSKAAREAYDAMDKLNTIATIQSPERAKLQARQTRLQSIIRLKGKNSPEGQQAQRDLEALQPQLRASYRSESNLNRDAFRKRVMLQLEKGGIRLGKRDLDFLMSTFESEDAYNRLVGNARGSIKSVGGMAGGTAGYTASSTVDTRNINAKLRDLFTDEWRQTYSPYLTASYTALGSSYANDRSLARYLGGGGSGGGGGRGGGGGAAINTQALNMKPMQGLGFGAMYDRWGNLMETPRALTPEEKQRQYILSQSQALMPSIPSLGFNEESPEVREWRKQQINKEEMREAFKEGLGDFTESMGKTANGISQLVSGVQQLGIKVPAGISKMLSVMQAITSILTAIQTLETIKGWFHNGGMVRAAMGYTVPGNYGFDAVPAMLTSGEVVLNRAQQGVLASQLADNARSMGTPTARVSGEDIYIAVSHYMQRRGYGEFAVAR
jgi:hypothetical protein